MLEDFHVGRFVPKDSLIHNLDPRTKLYGLAALTVILFSGNGPKNLPYGILLIALVVKLSKVPIKYYLASFKSLWLILIITVLLNGYTVAGHPLFTIGIASPSVEGIYFGGFLALRFGLLIIVSAAFTFTTSPLAAADGLERLLKPLEKAGLPIQEMTFMMAVAIRFIPTIIEEGNRLVRAIESRGGNLRSGGLLKRTKNLIPLLVPLFVGTFRRADEMALALEARCYRGKRTRLKSIGFSSRDYLPIALITLSLIIVLAIS